MKVRNAKSQVIIKAAILATIDYMEEFSWTSSRPGIEGSRQIIVCNKRNKVLAQSNKNLLNWCIYQEDAIEILKPLIKNIEKVLYRLTKTKILTPSKLEIVLIKDYSDINISKILDNNE